MEPFEDKSQGQLNSFLVSGSVSVQRTWLQTNRGLHIFWPTTAIIAPSELTFSSIFPMFFPLPFPDRKVRIIGEFVLVFTMIVSFADRPFSGLRCYCLKVMSRIFLPKALCLLVLAFASIPAGSISSPVQCFLFLLFVSFNFVLLHLTFNKAETTSRKSSCFNYRNHGNLWL